MAGRNFGRVLLGCDGHKWSSWGRELGGGGGDGGEEREGETERQKRWQLKGLALELIVQLTHAPAAQIGHNWIFIRMPSPRVCCAPYSHYPYLPSSRSVRTDKHDSL